MAPPPRQPFGPPPHPVPPPMASAGQLPAATQQFQPGPYQPGTQHTLIVSGGADAPYAGPPPARYRGPSESRLQRLLFTRRLGYLAAGLAAVLVIGLTAWWLTAGQYTTVPQVGRMTTTAAQAELRSAGFTVATRKAVLDNQVARGQVIRSIPAAGARVRKGGTITLIPSAGPHMISVPQVTGLGLAAAEAGLKHAGLKPGTAKTEPSATIPAGIVVSTNPAAGVSWPQPQPVTLVVSAGPPMPNLVGQPQQVAEQWAQANGVSLDEVTTTKSDAPVQTVVKQSVPAGSAFTRGQVIIITISAGPPMVTIPNVDGMHVNKAVHLLTRLGFQVSVNQVGPLDNVFRHDPSSQAPKGSTITLWVGL